MISYGNKPFSKEVLSSFPHIGKLLHYSFPVDTDNEDF